MFSPAAPIASMRFRVSSVVRNSSPVTRFISLAAITLAVLHGGGKLQAQQTAQVLHNQVRADVTDHRAAFISSMPTDEQLQLSIVLPLRNQAALTSLLGRLYDPSSPDYRKFLSVAEFTDQFAPTVDDYQAVVTFAQENGLTVTGAPANRLLVPISGSVQQVNTVFHVQMGTYQHPTENRTFFSPDREPSLNLSVPVAHISGLDSYSLPQPMSKVRPSDASANGQQSSAVLGSGPGGSYLGSDMRSAYYGGTTLTGSGQTVGILEFGGYLLSDVNSTFSNAGQSYTVPINNVLLDGATGAPGNDDGEQVLDIVQAIGMAPGLSQVRVYIGIGSDQAAILNSMASENIAKQLSCSWSWRPADPTTEDPFFQEMAAQGQSFFTASGDSGAYYAAVNPFFYPQEDKYVTTVGGTHLTTIAANGSWVSETVWNSGGDGSGGGISPDGVSIPSWQAGIANSANGGSNTLRNAPDVAMEGDFDNYNCDLGKCSNGWAGTSFSAPRWAAFMALVNQQAVEAGNAPNGGLGFINPTIYTLAQGAHASSDFHDITSGNNLTSNQPVWFSAVPGYDLATGWGSANGQSLIDDLAGPQTPGFFIGNSVGNVTVNPGSSAATTVSIADAGGFTGSVNLAITSTLPDGVTASFSPNPTATSSVLTFSATGAAADQTIPVTITGTSGTLSAKANLTLGVHIPTFALAVGSAGLNQSASVTSTVTVTPKYGFSGNVALTVTGLPDGVTASFSPATTNSTSTLTLTASSTVTAGTYTATVTGTSGSIAINATLPITIHGPSFTLSNGGSVNIGQGSNGTTYVYVNNLYGFTGSVNLAVSGLPSGVAASFSPNPTTGTSTLTLTASSSAAVGKGTLTITGTSGALTASTTVALAVYAPTFTLSGSGTVSVGQGTSGTSYVYVNDQYGFTGSVNLSVTGLPAGVTALWSPNPTTNSSTLTLSASSSVAVGQYNLTITGTAGTQTATTPLTLGVYAPTFTISDYSSVIIGQGTTATSYVSVTPQYGFTGSVNLSISGLPSGVTGTFSPNPTTGSATLTLTASSTATLGQYTATITGTSGTQTATTKLTVGVYVPTFTLSSYGLNIGQGTTASEYVYVQSQYGFTGSVNLSISGLPSGVRATFSPNPTTSSSNLVFTASAAAPAGQYTLTVTGTSGTQTASSTITLGIYTPTFTMSSSGSVSIGQGTTSTTYTYVNGQYGFAGNVNLAVTGLPAGVTASFSPNPTTYSSTITLTASSTATLGQYSAVITGTSGTQTASTPLTIGIYAPTFTLSSYSSPTIGQGSSSSLYVYVNNQYGFTGAVNLAVSGLPSGVTASISPNPTTYSSTITLIASSTAAVGTTTLTITGTSGSKTATTTVPLTIAAPTFTMYTSGSSLALDPGATGSSYIYINQQNGFSSSVTLSASGLPTGVTAAFATNPTTSSSQLTLTVSASAPASTSTVTVLGTAGSINYSVPISLTVYAPSFTLSGAPNELFVMPGSTARSSIAIIPVHGFTGSVSYTVSGLPSGVTASIAPNPTTGVSTLTVTAGNSASPGTATVIITGTSGALTATTKLPLTIGTASVSTTTMLALSAGGTAATSVKAGTAITATASVMAGSTAVKAGQVYFCDATATYCDSIHLLGTAQLTSAGTATFTFIPSAGDHSYKALFVGTNLAGTSTSTASALTATATLPTTTTIAQSGSQGNYTLTATVTGTGPVAPAGTVSFLDTNNSSAVLAKSSLAAGTATLTSKLQTITPSGTVQEIANADVNNDGIPDLLLATTTSLNIMLGKGDGTFATASASLPITTTAYSILSGDFNGDGCLDLAILQSSTNNIAIFLGNGNGTFSAAQSPATGSFPIAMVAGDFNHDGQIDLATVSSNNQTVTVQLGNGDGTFTPSPGAIGLTSTAGAVVKGDFNGDGNLDLAVSGSYNSSVTLLLGNGDGTFALGPVIATTAYANSLAVGDLNRDGKPDLIVGSAYSSISVYLGNGDGTFNAPTSLSTSTGSARLIIADFNGDGKLDIVSTGSGYNLLQTYLGNGDGTFAAPMNLNTAYGITDITSGDWNSDGLPDLAAVTYTNLSLITSSAAQTATATAASISPIGRGQHLVDASYAGSSAYAASVSGTTTLTSNIAPPTVTVTPSSSTVTAAQPLTVTINADGGTGNPTPTGSITVSGGGYTSTATLLNAGSASIIIPAGSISVGADTLTATYTPDTAGAANYATANGSATVTVSRVAPAVALTLSASTITTAQVLTATVAVNGTAGNALPTGAVTLISGSYTTQGTLINGTATFTIAAGTLPVGTDALQATYAPDGTSLYSAASQTTNVTVTAASTGAVPTITLAATAATITNLQTDTITVSVAGAAATPTGSVTLSSGTYSAQTLLANGKATFTLRAGVLNTGSATLTATYSGDAVYTTGTGTATVAVVPVISSTPTVNTITRGGSGSGSLALTAGSNYTGTLTLSCAVTAPPAGAVNLPTCSFNPATVTLAAGATGTAPFIISTTAATAALEHPFDRTRWGFEGSALAALILFMVPARRRRPAALLTLLLAFAVVGISGCAGSNGGGSSSGGGSGTSTSNPGTTAGTYTLTLTAADSAAMVSTTANVSVVVQ